MPKIINKAGARQRLFQGYDQDRLDNVIKRQKIIKRDGVIEVNDDNIQVTPAVPVVKNGEPIPAPKADDIPADKGVDAPEVIKLELKEPVKIQKVAFYVPFSKVDKEKHLVTGIASSEAVDSYGDVVEFQAIKEALPSYLEFGNIREMHGASAVGVVKESDLKGDKKQWWITTKVVDDSAWEKVIEGVYKGYSIGGNIIDAEPLTIEVPKSMIDESGNVDKKAFNDYVASGIKKADDEEMITVYTGGWRITKLELIEVSLVDRPANPDALISSFKSAVNSFIPDSVIMFNPIEKLNIINKSLTQKDIRSILNAKTVGPKIESHNKFIKILANKFNKNMKKDKKQILKDLVASIVKQFEEKGLDLSKADDNEAVEVSTADMLKVIELSCQVAVNTLVKVEEGDGEGEGEGEGEGGDADPEPEPKPKEKDPEGEGEGEGEDEEKAEKARKAKIKKAEDKEMSNTFGLLTKTIKTLAKDVEDIKKAGEAESTQKAEDIKENESEDKSVFKGMFS